MSYRIKHFFELSEISINYITTINDEFTKNKKTDLEKFNLLDLQLNYHIFSYTQIIFLINKQLLLEHHKGENIIAAFKTGNLGYVNELGNKFKHSKRMFIYNYTVDGPTDKTQPFESLDDWSKLNLKSFFKSQGIKDYDKFKFPISEIKSIEKRFDNDINAIDKVINCQKELKEYLTTNNYI